MIKNKALKMRIYPTSEQAEKIDAIFDCCRFVYNHMLERNNKVFKRRGEHLSYIDMQNLLPKMKEYLPWLAVDSQALKYSCRCLDNAYQKFFRKQANFPKFHSKKDRQSYTTTNASTIHYKNGKVKLPTIGWIKTNESRELNGQICKATVSRKNGKYFVSILYKYEIDVIPTEVGTAIGLDYKSDGLYADSEGSVCGSPKFYRKSQKALAKAQRSLSKKKKCSKNRERAKQKVARIHEHIANQRKDFLHKESTKIANSYDLVCVEDLDMRAMSNKGFGNGKATLDNGYGMFVNMLNYKLADRGKQLIKVDKWYPSSQICSKCGHKQKMELSERTYRCAECGAVIDRDYNAALNILNEGLRMLKTT